jgi:hypothetical protein
VAGTQPVEHVRKAYDALVELFGEETMGPFSDYEPLRLRKPRGPRRTWSDEDLRQMAASFDSAADFSAADRYAYKAAKRRGIVKPAGKARPRQDDIFLVPQEEVSDDQLRAIASKYTSRGVFLGEDNMAYNIARFRGILEEICEDMDP